MSRRSLVAGLALVGVLAAGAGTGRAADASASGRLRGPLEPAWKEASAMGQRSLSAEEATRVTLLGYAVAASRSCPGLALERGRIRAAMKEIAEDRLSRASEEEAQSLSRRVAFHMGVSVGVFLSEHALAPERFCTGVQEALQDPEIAAFFTSGEAAAPTSPGEPTAR